MSCIDELKYEVLLSQCSFKEAREYIKNNFKEVIEVPPGYRIFDTFLIGVPPLFVGVEGEDVIIPFTKPCYGTYVMRIKGGEEIEKLRAKR
ncbi:DUF1894 domain-containing protein [Methanotrichaceae archaeon M04Ac]|uniref:DUF1894 domain-containing protein n=1 Tax=Candidatus Methanocrinis alkalitolerans TaxID=3033395 RepID=A0ABT5XGG1_9EURY|nr:DUF1894 domain-containing protein [Candidatus Methanocrinis alkalitolerans]MCR3884244.1 DUF1894 domain-containing protein [Methanothrix sp.]MDF0593577.1 DUF1894 domain-containing protein [Candidatus Methanocrinis alkalitolerans]